jgi:hypothetical protein
LWFRLLSLVVWSTRTDTTFNHMSVCVQELPTEAWEQFLAHGDGPALLARLLTLPNRPAPQEVTYPEHHRLCDIELAGQAYRVSRLVDLDHGQERLFIELTDVPSFDSPGVPYWLQGAALARWIRDETAYPTKDEVDWESYRS